MVRYSAMHWTSSWALTRPFFLFYHHSSKQALCDRDSLWRPRKSRCSHSSTGSSHTEGGTTPDNVNYGRGKRCTRNWTMGNVARVFWAKFFMPVFRCIFTLWVKLRKILTAPYWRLLELLSFVSEVGSPSTMKDIVLLGFVLYAFTDLKVWYDY